MAREYTEHQMRSAIERVAALVVAGDTAGLTACTELPDLYRDMVARGPAGPYDELSYHLQGAVLSTRSRSNSTNVGVLYPAMAESDERLAWNQGILLCLAPDAQEWDVPLVAHPGRTDLPLLWVTGTGTHRLQMVDAQTYAERIALVPLTDAQQQAREDVKKLLEGLEGDHSLYENLTRPLDSNPWQPGQNQTLVTARQLLNSMQPHQVPPTYLPVFYELGHVGITLVAIMLLCQRARGETRRGLVTAIESHPYLPRIMALLGSRTPSLKA